MDEYVFDVFFWFNMIEVNCFDFQLGLKEMISSISIKNIDYIELDP